MGQAAGQVGGPLPPTAVCLAFALSPEASKRRILVHCMRGRECMITAATVKRFASWLASSACLPNLRTQ